MKFPEKINKGHTNWIQLLIFSLNYLREYFSHKNVIAIINVVNTKLRLIRKCVSMHFPLILYVIQKITKLQQRDLMEHYFPSAFNLHCQGFRNIITLAVFFVA